MQCICTYMCLNVGCFILFYSKGVMASIQEYVTEYSSTLQEQKKSFYKSQSDVYILMDKLCQVSTAAVHE